MKNKAGQTEIWGLVSLHIITKDLPNWFWADFGHIDCETAAGACADEAPAETPLRDSTTHGAGTAGSDGVRKETTGSKWQFYRLRGTQIDFITPFGVDTILSNPVIEGTFQKSSCMTCHSYASGALASEVPAVGTSLPIIAGVTGVPNAGSQSDDIGSPKCERFVTPRGGTSGHCTDVFDETPPLYFQTDFLWSIPFRAFSEKPIQP